MQIFLPAPRPIAVVIIASRMGEFVKVKAPPRPGVVLPAPPPGGLDGKVVPSWASRGVCG